MSPIPSVKQFQDSPVPRVKQCSASKILVKGTKPRSKPQCVRCRNHGTLVDKQGHKKVCKWRDCKCIKCKLLDDRKDVESKIKDVERNDKQTETQTHEEKSILVNQKLNQLRLESSVGSHPVMIPPQYNHRRVLDFSIMSESFQSTASTKTILDSIQKIDQNFIDYHKQKFTNHTIDKILNHEKELITDQSSEPYIMRESDPIKMETATIVSFLGQRLIEFNQRVDLKNWTTFPLKYNY